MNYKKLGLVLKSARSAAGLSQTQVSRHIGKTPQNISSWELGKSKIDIDSFECLCRLYDIPFIDTLNLVINDISEEYIRLTDEDVISIYKNLPAESKSFIKHAVYVLSEQ